jgi:2-succinyl-6-hydroxy-2,4-cyclohexadiene-1-carboxylate synthase
MLAAVEHVVALHGFAGTGASWGAVAEHLGPGWTVHAPDLPGHGSASDSPVSLDACIETALDAAPGRFVLAGYSMGGRVALHVALAAPERVVRLVLVATTAGIADAGERAARAVADEEWAASIERSTIEQFADRWMGQSLFAGTPSEAALVWRRDILRNSPAGVAAARRALGSGTLEPVWGRLGELRMPAAVVVGERDAAYLALGEQLVSALPAAEPLVVVPRAGHGLPREDPAAVAAAIAGAAASR